MLCERCQVRIEPAPPPINEAVFDRARQSIIVGDEYCATGHVAWKALELLWAKRTRLVRKGELYKWLYGDDLDPPLDNVVKVHICHLRKALKGSPYRIAAIWGAGYRLESAQAIDPVPIREITQTSKSKASFSGIGSSSDASVLPGISHELRTSLNVVIGFAQLVDWEIYGPLGDPRYAECATAIVTGGNRVLTVISAILSLTEANSRSSIDQSM